MRYKIDEVHKKLASFLCKNVKIVLLPKFESSRMVRNANRNISSVTARKMLTWGHYRFRVTLINKAALTSSCQVIICDEAYTSKTCGSCGKLHRNLKSQKTFRCPHCGIVIDRDVNGARNILLRFLTLNNLVVFKRGGDSRVVDTTFAPTSLGVSGSLHEANFAINAELAIKL